MARQPFHPQYKDSPTSMGAVLIEKLPKLAELVGRITINWSGVDLQLSLTLGGLLGVDNAAAVAVFLSLKNNRAKREALQAAAEKSLTNEIKKILDAILKIHDELDKQRNDVVHGIWGIAESTPDGIIWSSLQDHAKMLINDYHLESQSKLDAQERPFQITKDYFVVKYKDLEELNADIIKLGHNVMNFHSYLRYKDQIQGEAAFKDLLNDSMLAKALACIK